MNTNELKLLYRTDFLAFANLVGRILNVPAPFLRGQQVELFADAASRCTPGAGERVMVNAPPRHLKSIVCSIAWPLFVAASHQGKRVVVISGTRELAVELAEKRRSVLKDGRYRAVFEGLNATSQGSDTIRFSNGSEIIHGSMGRSMIGRGADVIVLDDPQTPTHVRDEARRQEAFDWYSSELAPRLNGSAGSVLVVMQRLHPDDLAHRLLWSPTQWILLSLSAITRFGEKWTLQNGIVRRRPAGDVLCPAIASKDELSERLDQVGARAFYAQFLQDPLRAWGDSETRCIWIPPRVYDGWEPHMPTLRGGGILVPFAWTIREQYFGAPEWIFGAPEGVMYTGVRKPTDVEFQEHCLIQQRRLVLDCAIAAEESDRKLEERRRKSN